MTTLLTAATRNLWVGLMTVASTVTTLVLACATPFPALAALAGTHVRRTEGMVLMVTAWAMSQAVGFFVLGYPLNAGNLAWSAALGTAAVGSLLAAGAMAARLGGAHVIVRLSLTYVTAYVGFKAIVLLWSFALDDGWAAFTAEVLLRQFIRYGAILIGLVVFHKLLELAGVRVLQPPAATRV